MSLVDFFNSLKGDMLKNRLLNIWVPPHKLEGVDFNNMEQVEQLAEQLVPDLIRANPVIANMIKQNSSMLWADKQKEVVDVIDSIK
jgi:hypothetical protein